MRQLCLAGLAAMWTACATASPVPDFLCDLGPDTGYELVFDENRYPLSGAIYYAGGDRIAFTGYPMTEAEWWPRVPWDAGERYVRHGITVTLSGDAGMLVLPDGREFPCARHIED
jgi:hypothetical protein